MYQPDFAVYITLGVTIHAGHLLRENKLHTALSRICEALDALQALVLASWTDDRTLNEAFGWNCAAVTRQDLAAMPRAIATRLRDADIETLEPSIEKLLSDIPRRIQLLHPTTVPHIFNGNAVQAVPAFIGTLDSVMTTLRPLLGWQTLQDTKAMPAPLARRLRSIQAELDSIVPNKDELQSKIRQIEEATDAAESLPTDLQALQEARAKLAAITKGADSDYADISQRKTMADADLLDIKSRQLQAEKLVLQCEEAYRITTTKGLAASFDQRAISLSSSMWIWVLGLMVSLSLGAYIGSERLQLLSTSLNSTNPEWGTIWMQALLSALSLGAPLWFAWLATKQVGQRFRLAEDYAFKAAVAKAYEGYRREAARIDEVFEARLFASALTRLEEAPLRLVEGATHGSPWHELINSNAFQAAITTVPELRDKFIELAKSGIDVLKKNRAAASASEKPTGSKSGASDA